MPLNQETKPNRSNGNLSYISSPRTKFNWMNRVALCTKRVTRIIRLWIKLQHFMNKNDVEVSYLVGWGCRIHWLHLCRGVIPPPNECPRYNTKQSDGEVPVMLELWRMQSTSSLSSLSGPLWLGVVVPDRVLSMGQIELNSILMLNWIAWNRTVFDIETVLKLNWTVWNRTVFDKNYTYNNLNYLK